MTLESAPVVDAAPAAFAALDGGARWALSGELTMANAGDVLDLAQHTPLPSQGVVDCVALHAVDSAAVALLLALKRRANAERRPLAFVNVPEPLSALATLYGVEELLIAA